MIRRNNRFLNRSTFGGNWKFLLLSSFLPSTVFEIKLLLVQVIIGITRVTKLLLVELKSIYQLY